MDDLSTGDVLDVHAPPPVLPAPLSEALLKLRKSLSQDELDFLAAQARDHARRVYPSLVAWYEEVAREVEVAPGTVKAQFYGRPITAEVLGAALEALDKTMRALYHPDAHPGEVSP